MLSIENKTFDEIRIGDTASVQRTLQVGDVRAWATAFGDAGLLAEPGHMSGAVGIIDALLTSLAGSRLPGPGSCVRSSAVQVRAALPIDSVLTAKVVVREKRSDEKIVVLDGQCTDATGQPIATAVLEVVAPLKRVRREVPEHKLDGLLERRRGLKPMLTGVVHPCSADALSGAVESAEAKLIMPVDQRPCCIRLPRPQNSTCRAAKSWRPKVPKTRRRRRRPPRAPARCRR